MPQRIIMIVLLIGLLFGLTMLVSGMSAWRLPDNQRGYSPEQPIAFSHHLHAGELKLDCRFCHSASESSRHAGIPSADVCMKCHNFVTAPYDEVQKEARLAKENGRKAKRIVSSELKKLYDSMGLDEELRPIEGETPQSIPWIRVHNLPDYVVFNHQAHVNSGVSCQHCHGPVETMHRVRQHSSLSMGWCVNCHREVNENGVHGREVHASTNCTVCHH